MRFPSFVAYCLGTFTILMDTAVAKYDFDVATNYPKMTAASEHKTLVNQKIGDKVQDIGGHLNMAASYSSGFTHVSQCGGHIEGLAGAINYKVGEKVDLDETCVWTVLVPRKSTIQIRLIHDGFYSNFQTIAIYNTTSSTRYQFLNPAVYINGGDRNAYNVTGGSLLKIAFGNHPWYETNATGFSLVFEGLGPDTNSSDWRVPIFNIIEHNDTNSGRISYQENSSSSPSEGEFVIFVIHPEPQKEIALTLESFRGPPRSENCAWNFVYWYDTVRITEVAWSTESAILFQECRETRYNTTIYSTYPLVVSLYSFTGNRRSFEISWEMV